MKTSPDIASIRHERFDKATAGENATIAGSEPLVSVLMANYRGGAHLPAALDSVLAQTVHSLEVIVSDDASPDSSVEIVRQYMARDSRVRLIANEENRGPAAARNRALEAARGEWIAIVDSDDVIHPERLETMIAAADALGADGIADDLLFFSDVGAGPTLLGETTSAEPRRITPADFIRSNTSGNGLPPLGYVKPLFRRARLARLRYDEAVRIGEDYDFLLRFLLAGAQFYILPDPLYLYRRHAHSISHRLSESTVLAMITNQQRLVAAQGSFSPEIEQLLHKRMAALRSSLSFERLVVSLKERRAAKALGLLISDLGLIRPLARSVAENLQSRMKKRPSAPRGRRIIALHDQTYRPNDVNALHDALGVGGDIELVPVASYRPPAERRPAGQQERGNLLRLAAMSMEANLEIVCHGLAGLNAAGFLPRKRILATILDDAKELRRACHWPAPEGSRIIAAQTALESNLEGLGQPFCPGYLLISPAPRPAPQPAISRVAEAPETESQS